MGVVSSMPGAAAVREARPEDAPSIAALHVAAWHETYAGLLPAGMIAAQSEAARLSVWTRILGDPAAATAVEVAAAAPGLVGFGACGAQRSADLAAAGFDGEISALYVLRSAQRRGVGTALMAALATRLLRAGHRAASLWVLRENAPARRFYRGIGGAVVGERVERLGRDSVAEVAYGWPDAATIGRRPAVETGAG